MSFTRQILNTEELSALVAKIQAANRFWIFTHEYPDGDALGSSGALALALKSLGKQVGYYLLEPPSRMYKEVPGNELATITSELPNNLPDIVFILDSGNLHRIGKNFVEQLQILGFVPYSSGAPESLFLCVNFDHHVSNDHYGHINFVSTKAAATAEMIFELLDALNVELTQAIAEALYIGIVTDTGKFFYSNTTPHTLAIGSELLKTGFEPEAALAKVYYTRTVEQLKLFGAILSTLEANSQLGYVICYATLDMYAATGGSYEDTETLTDILKTIGEYKTSLLVKQQSPYVWKVSMRNTRADFNASVFAQRFNGGGHPGAAGFTITGELNEVLHNIKTALNEDLLKLK